MCVCVCLHLSVFDNKTGSKSKLIRTFWLVLTYRLIHKHVQHTVCVGVSSVSTCVFQFKSLFVPLHQDVFFLSGL